LADTTRKDPVKKPSVTSHKLFPAVVVVWFAALFGLVSLAIRPAVIEGIVLATGIDHVIAQAAPPLGNTMRLLLALLMTVLGGLVGLFVARRIVKSAMAPAARRRTGPAAENVSAVAALDDEDAAIAVEADDDADEDDEVQPIARRRQQLAILDEDESLDDHAPVPGNGHILDVAELPLKSFDEIDGIWLHESDRSTVHQEAQGEHTRANGFAHDLSADDAQGTEMAADLADGSDAEDASGKSNNRLFDAYVRRVNAGAEANVSDETAPGFISLPSATLPDVTPVTKESDPVATPAAATSAPAPLPTFSNTAERIASAPLDELSHVELLERLAQTIARRRAVPSAAHEHAAAPPIPLSVPEVSAPVTQATQDSATVTVLPRVAAQQPARAEGEVPVALRPHWADMQDDDEPLPSYVPPRSIALPEAAPQQAPAPEPVDEVDEDEILEEGYSSLRGLSKPASETDTVSEDELEPSEAPRVARFAMPTRDGQTTTTSGARMFDAPSTAEPGADQTEQALRAALATLRRMSGAA
jgi:hypothetical protein